MYSNKLFGMLFQIAMYNVKGIFRFFFDLMCTSGLFYIEVFKVSDVGIEQLVIKCY